MSDANQDTGAEASTNDAPLDGDDLTNRMAELLGGDDGSDEGTAEEVTEGNDGDQSNDDTQDAETEPLYTVKVDGQDIQVKQSELLAGYQRDADYRNKTMAVAEQRKAVEAERQSVTQERNTALQVIERFQAQLGQLQPQVDWDRLANEDPAEFVRQQHLFAQRQQQYNQAEQAKQYMLAQGKQEQEAHLKMHLQTETENLRKAIPDFADPVKAEKASTAIKEYLKGLSFTDADITSVADHRMLVVADKARRYDELMKKASLSTKQVQKTPVRSERPGSAETRTNGRAEALKRLDRSGSVTDAARAFEQFS